MITVDLDDLNSYAQVLQDGQQPMADRVDSLFCIKAFTEIEAVECLFKAFELEKSSQLLRHEICYCLGQMNKTPEHVDKIQ